MRMRRVFSLAKVPEGNGLVRGRSEEEVVEGEHLEEEVGNREREGGLATDAGRISPPIMTDDGGLDTENPIMPWCEYA